ncbi:MAG: hypothetical protein ACXADU_16410 [Promethearchaeota archaeon]
MTKVSLEELKKEIPEIFERVKKDVRRVWGRQRAGLSLEMGELGIYKGGFIGGAHVAPGTSIVMNETALKELIKQQPYEIVWAYTYHILLHEYIHSFRVLDEQLCREITLRITEKVFKEEDHPAVVIARKGIGIFFPELKYAPPGLHPDGKQFEYIDNFDKESYEHYS